MTNELTMILGEYWSGSLLQQLIGAEAETHS